MRNQLFQRTRSTPVDVAGGTSTGQPLDVTRTLAALSGVPAHELVDSIAELRGRPIVVIDDPSISSAAGICGVWMSLDDRDLVIVSNQFSNVHHDHVVLHELAHLLCEHQTVAADLQQQAAAMFPNLAPEFVATMLARSRYDDPQEREAETMASLILSNTRGLDRRSWVNDPSLRRAADVVGGVR